MHETPPDPAVRIASGFMIDRNICLVKAVKNHFAGTKIPNRSKNNVFYAFIRKTLKIVIFMHKIRVE
jgi:hypothetical protein